MQRQALKNNYRNFGRAADCLDCCPSESWNFSLPGNFVVDVQRCVVIQIDVERELVGFSGRADVDKRREIRLGGDYGEETVAVDEYPNCGQLVIILENEAPGCGGITLRRKLSGNFECERRLKFRRF